MPPACRYHPSVAPGAGSSWHPGSYPCVQFASGARPVDLLGTASKARSSKPAFLAREGLGHRALRRTDRRSAVGKTSPVYLRSGGVSRTYTATKPSLDSRSHVAISLTPRHSGVRVGASMNSSAILQDRSGMGMRERASLTRRRRDRRSLSLCADARSARPPTPSRRTRRPAAGWKRAGPTAEVEHVLLRRASAYRTNVPRSTGRRSVCTPPQVVYTRHGLNRATCQSTSGLEETLTIVVR